MEQVGLWATRLGWHKILVITDEHLVAAGATERVTDSLSEYGVISHEFTGGQAEPTLALVEQAVNEARSFSPDAILGLGGGSNIDLAKIAAAVYSHGGQARDYIGEDKIPGPVVPLICIPTTAGTGSEVSCSCVLTDAEQKLKVSALSWHLRPRLAIVDPTLTLTCPQKVTAESGVDALVHAVEALTVIDVAQFPVPDEDVSIYQGRNLLSNTYAERAIQLIGEHLLTAYRSPDQLPARTGMSLAATLAGMAFINSGLALVHAFEYPLGGLVHVSHGTGNMLFLPHVMRFNLPQRQSEYAMVAKLAGRNVTGLTTAQAAQSAIDWVCELQREMQLPTRLRDLGVTAEQLPALADKTLGIRRLVRLNPRQPSYEEVLQILQAAF